MKTLGQVLKLAADHLQKTGEKRPRRVAEELLSFVLKIKRLDLYMQFDRPLEERELGIYRDYLKKKSQGTPLEYILGEVDFFGCSLLVTPDVLIPRPETEIFLDKICQLLGPSNNQEKKVWDLCTGSGCLGIGLKKKFPQMQVFLSDLSPKALKIAQENAKRNEVEVELLEGDLLYPFKDKKADIVVCNPPYVSEKEYALLGDEVRCFEPALALIGGEDGLAYYSRLAKELPNYLQPGAKVFFEIGAFQAKALENLFCASCWTRKRTEKDWAGHDRFFFLEFE